MKRPMMIVREISIEAGEMIVAVVGGMALMLAVGVSVILAPVWFALKPEPRKDQR